MIHRSYDLTPRDYPQEAAGLIELNGRFVVGHHVEEDGFHLADPTEGPLVGAFKGKVGRGRLVDLKAK